VASGQWSEKKLITDHFSLREVERVAKEENRTKSELIREAPRRCLEDREWEKLTRYARTKSAEAGIKTEEDIQQVVDEHRGAKAND
jgi:CopG family transcriptional regulator/antitoxin EndoAI